MPFWFERDTRVDREVAARFAETLAAAASGSLDGWLAEPRAALALVIVLDQFPRNIHRGTPQAFAHDDAALASARRVIAAGHFERLHPVEQAFLSLPFQHAENAACQRESVALAERLVDHAPGEWRSTVQPFLHYARLHLEIIERFGRFPHRNGVLGRRSTPEESAYMASGAETFGQS